MPFADPAAKRAYRVRYDRANRHLVTARHAEYVAERRDEINAYQRAYRAKYRARHAWQDANKRAKSWGVVCGADRDHFVKLWSSPCQRCGKDPAEGVDHIVPMSLGGGHVDNNLQPFCLTCNMHKSWRGECSHA